MTKREELDFFVNKCDELIDSKYILADIKIINLLKSIAMSNTLVALLKNCLTDFDYQIAKDKYFVKSKGYEGKGEFIAPSNPKEFLALVFNVLMDIDSRRVELGEFLDKYFYEDGSYYAGYALFIDSMIKPFKQYVKTIMEKVLEGSVQDPVDAICEEETRKANELKQAEEQKLKEKELSQKAFGENIKLIKDILADDKNKVNTSKKSETVKQQMILVIKMFESALDISEKDGIYYAFTAYKFMAKSYKFMFFGRIGKIQKLLSGIVNEL